jgi:outer membrane receptor protein involved in Fe transport
MKNLFAFVLVCGMFAHLQGSAQWPSGGGKKAEPTGRLYGKVVEEQSGKPMEFVVVRVFQEIADSVSGRQQKLVSGALTETNGDFSVDKVPAAVSLSLLFSFPGYDSLTVTTRLEPRPGGIMEKDLGNIRMKVAPTALGEVVVSGDDGAYRLEFDKRVYDVDKNPVNAGGTAEDVLRNVPSLQVDMDGNVNLRGGSPQVFVDGRPTTLSIDQIPADAIQRVEVITNPSAKWDAGGGTGGIVNIVMKHNRGTGYSGSMRTGMDSRARVNSGLEANLRQGKFNFFINGNFNQRRNLINTETDRLNLGEGPETRFIQDGFTENNGFFGSGKAGIDFFADNRNTLTLSQSINRGRFNPLDEIFTRTDSLLSETGAFSTYDRFSDTERQFRNLGSSLLYKHLFSREGTELTADFNFNAISSEFIGDYINAYNSGDRSVLRQDGGGRQRVFTTQTDFVTLLNDQTKIELGARGNVRFFESVYQNYQQDTAQNYVRIPALDVDYAYVDEVYALYGTFAKDYKTWKLQAGLRAESSLYQGELRDTTVTFTIAYPLSFFPSVFVTRVIDKKQDIQLALTRRIARPSFMQLIPFTDYADSLNVSRGNPELTPEFTHLAELSYQYSEGKKFTFIASTYFRYISNLTIRHQFTEYSEVMDESIVVNTYANAASSQAIGLELVSRQSLAKWAELNLNFNLYHSAIDGNNVSPGLTNERTSYWVKVNLVNKLPGNFTVQLTGDYQSRRALEVGSGERGGMGGGGMGGGGMGGGGWGGANNTVQGYVEPMYSIDFSVRKEFGKNRNLAAGFTISDALRTRVSDIHSESPFFVQDTFRRRDPQLWRFNLSWKFGKMDSTLFRRKNTRNNSEGGEM